MSVLTPKEETLLERILRMAEGYVEQKTADVLTEFADKQPQDREDVYNTLQSAREDIQNAREVLRRLELIN